jgi:hypothetical protein
LPAADLVALLARLFAGVEDFDFALPVLVFFESAITEYRIKFSLTIGFISVSAQWLLAADQAFFTAALAPVAAPPGQRLACSA